MGVPEAELVELTDVGGQRGGPRMATVFAVVVASLAFLAILGLVPPRQGLDASTAPTGSGTASVVAVASATPTPRLATSSPTARPATQPSPTAPPRTPGPGEWIPSLVAPGELVYPKGLWAVNGRFVVLSRSGSTDFDQPIWRVHSSTDGTHWLVENGPSVVDDFAAGSVIGGRLWFGARLPGVSDADTRWELVSTLDGGNWDVLGEMQGWGIGHGIGSLARIGETWVATRFQDGTDETSVELLWSPDGVHWAVASMPVDVDELELGDGWINVGRFARIADTIVVHGSIGNYEQTIPFTLTSRDGRTWSRSDLPTRPNTAISGLVCNTDRCVMPAFISGDTETLERSVFVSTDGRSWRESALDLPNPREPTFSQVVATPTGFLATGITIGMAWISQDGVHWQSVWVMPAEHPSWFESLVANGDMAGGFGPSGSEDDRPFFWHGAIPLMAG